MRPELGDLDDLRALATALRRAGISLVLGLVLNHVAREHAWAQAARADSARHRAYFLTFGDRELPDAYERTLPEVFPDSAPGSSTWEPELDAWVWTTFHGFQWDVDGKRLTTGDGTNTTTRYQWDTDNELPQLAREATGSGALLRSYTPGLDTVSRTTPGGTSYYHYDGLGSVTDLTDRAGAQQTEYRYDAFGDLREETNAAGAPDNKLKDTASTTTSSQHLPPPRPAVRQPPRTLHPRPTLVPRTCRIRTSPSTST